jgi:hypothetical protein
MSKVECVLLERTQQIAREKGLLEQGGKINCQYAHICNGLKCLLLDKPQYITMYLRKKSDQNLISQTDRFYNKLERYFQINHD